MTSSSRTRFAVLYKPAPGEPAAVWLHIEDVPETVDTAGVTDALQGWRRWTEWSARIAIGGQVSVVRAGQSARTLPQPETITLTWSELVPESRTLTVPIPGGLYGALSAEARRRGISLRELGAEVVALGWMSVQGMTETPGDKL